MIISGVNEVRAAIGPMTAVERAMGRFMRAPDGHGGDGGADAGGAGAGGGALGDAFGLGDDAAPDTGEQGGGDGGQGGPQADAEPVGDLPWHEQISAEVIDGEDLSHRDWVKAAGFKDLNGLVKSVRDNQRALRAGGKIEVPKDGATPEQVEAFHKAIGRPDSAEGYEIALPEGVEGEIDATLLGSFRETAFKAGLPAGMAKQLGDWYVQQQLDMNAAMVAQRDAEVQATLKEWGAERDANVALGNRAAAKLGLNAKDIADMQKGFGAGRTLKLFAQLGAGLAEDAMMEGGGRGTFGVTPEQARAELDQLLKDPETSAKILAGDTALRARKARLEQAIAADMDRRQRVRA